MEFINVVSHESLSELFISIISQINILYSFCDIAVFSNKGPDIKI